MGCDWMEALLALAALAVVFVLLGVTVGAWSIGVAQIVQWLLVGVQ